MPIEFKPFPKIILQKYIDRFWSKIDKRELDSCWPWTGSLLCRAYGQFSILDTAIHKFIQVSPHRLSFYLSTGIDPLGKFVCHSCDNPPCCNPNHLWLGTNQENQKDRVLKGTCQQKGEDNGCSKLTNVEILEIREMFSTGNYTQVEIANKYLVSKTVIWYILHRKSWAHI